MSAVGIILGLTALVATAKAAKRTNKAAKVAKALHKQYSGMKETDPGMKDFLFTIWKNLGLTDKAVNGYINDRIAWSAAFISYVMTKAGYKDFPKSASHSCYNEDARNNRENKTGKFWLYRIDEYKPRVGDIVSKERAGSSISFDSVRCGQLSHSDIVVEVLPNEIVTIGGNVGNTVSITRVPTKNGYIAKAGYYGIIKNLHA